MGFMELIDSYCQHKDNMLQTDSTLGKSRQFGHDTE